MASTAGILRNAWRRLRARLSVNAGIAIFSLSVIVIVFGSVIANSQSERQKTIENAVRQNSNLALAIEEHTIRTLKGVDAVTLFLKHDFERRGKKIELTKYLENSVIDGKLATAISVFDERGRMVASTHPVRSGDFSAREHYAVHVRRDSGQMYISRPVLARISREWSIYLTRRINKPDGSFGGVVSMTVDPHYFTNFYQQTDLGSQGLVTLIGFDGITRARRAGQVASFGQDVSGSRLFAEQAKDPVGTFLSGGTLESVPRYTSFRTVPGYKLIVVVGMAQDEVLAEYSRQRDADLFGATLFSVVIVCFSALLMVAVRRQKRAVVALAASNIQFRATFEQAAVGISHTTLDRRFLDVNQKFCDMLGYTRGELLAMRSNQIAAADDQAPGADNQRALAGEIATYSGEKRYIRKDGSTFWAFRTVSLARDATGKPLYFIRVVEDISPRKEAEEHLRKVARARAVMAECNRVLVHAGDESQLLHDMCQAVVKSGGYRHAWVGFAEHDEFKSVRPAAQAGIDRAALKRARISWGDGAHGQGASGKTIRSGKPTLVKNVFAGHEFHLWQEMAREHGFVSTITLPLCDGGSTFGILKIHAAEVDAFDAEEITLLEVLAADLAYGIVSLRARADHKRAEAALKVNEELMRSIFDNAAVGISHDGLDARFLQVNQKLCAMLGYAREELLGMKARDVTHPDDREINAHRRAQILAGEMSTYSAERRCLRKDGSLIWVNQTVSLVRDAAGTPLHFVRVVEDITERKAAESALRTSEETLRATFSQAGVGIIITSPEQRYLHVNDKYCDMLGYAREELLGMSNTDVLVPQQVENVLENRRKLIRGEVQNVSNERQLVRKDGSLIWIHQSTSLARDPNGGPRHFITVVADISERKRAEEQLTHLAHHDGLTGLPNRGLFYDRLGHALDQARRRNWIAGVMFVDLDRFKAVNDTLGHDAGDQLLREVAARLTQCVRSDDTVGRLGGDEFAVILTELARVEDAGLVAQKIIAALAAPFAIGGKEVFVTASVGIATYPGDADTAAALIKNADAAMYRIKGQGKNNFQFYTATMNVRAAESLQLENDLRYAIQRDEFVLHFQPKADLKTGRITGVEALLRWQRPDGRLVSPAEFIPLLEESGLIVPAGEWVLRAACAQICNWRKAGLALVPIAVNLSAKQFHQQNICAMVQGALEEYNVESQLLELEITESAAMHDAEAATTMLRDLKAIGVRIAIDDFGTGYSSLSYLKRFPIDSLKIDRSFITELPGNRGDASIAKAVITMAHALGLKVVAEGVEDEAQLAFLALHACDEMQGYYFSRPLPAEQCTQFLGAERALPLPAVNRGHLRRALAAVT